MKKLLYTGALVILGFYIQDATIRDSIIYMNMGLNFRREVIKCIQKI